MARARPGLSRAGAERAAAGGPRRVQGGAREAAVGPGRGSRERNGAGGHAGSSQWRSGAGRWPRRAKLGAQRCREAATPGRAGGAAAPRGSYTEAEADGREKPGRLAAVAEAAGPARTRGGPGEEAPAASQELEGATPGRGARRGRRQGGEQRSRPGERQRHRGRRRKREKAGGGCRECSSARVSFSSCMSSSTSVLDYGPAAHTSPKSSPFS